MMEPSVSDYSYGYKDNICNAKIELHNRSLWDKFNNYGTEMIITKTGRRMFPYIQLLLKDLDPNAHYSVFLDFPLAQNSRFKFSCAGGWTPAGHHETQSPTRLYTHPDSPSTGAHWMSQEVSFAKVKLTNLSEPQSAGQIVLTSMHKYHPRVIIVKTSETRGPAPSKTFVLAETQFIAVTAYQNEKITKLKIDNNPFAKGFRENGKSNSKRKHGDDVRADSPTKRSLGSSRTTSPESDPDEHVKIPSGDLVPTGFVDNRYVTPYPTFFGRYQYLPVYNPYYYPEYRHRLLEDEEYTRRLNDEYYERMRKYQEGYYRIVDHNGPKDTLVQEVERRGVEQQERPQQEELQQQDTQQQEELQQQDTQQQEELQQLLPQRRELEPKRLRDFTIRSILDL